MVLVSLVKTIGETAELRFPVIRAKLVRASKITSHLDGVDRK